MPSVQHDFVDRTSFVLPTSYHKRSCATYSYAINSSFMKTERGAAVTATAASAPVWLFWSVCVCVDVCPADGSTPPLSVHNLLNGFGISIDHPLTLTPVHALLVPVAHNDHDIHWVTESSILVNNVEINSPPLHSRTCTRIIITRPPSSSLLAEESKFVSPKSELKAALPSWVVMAGQGHWFYRYYRYSWISKGRHVYSR